MNGIKIDRFVTGTTAKESPSGTTPLWAFLNRDISLFRSVRDADKESFYRQLATLLEAGIDLKSTLDLLIDQWKGKLKPVLTQLKEDLIQGSALSTSMRAQRVFTPYEYFSIQIGEETGRLAAVAQGLAGYFQKRVKQKRQLIGALIYPFMVILTSFAAVFFMMQFIVPMFADIFRRSGNELPGITQAILSFSAFFKRYAWIGMGGVIAVVGWLYSRRRQDWMRRWASRVLLGVPVFGVLIRKIFLARFCHSMALLTASRVSLIQALQLSRQMVGFYPIEVSLAEVEKNVLNGQSLHSSLAAFPIYDATLVSLVSVGEEVNQLPLFFEKVAAQYNDEVEHRSALLSSVLEPFIILFLGLFVGLILIAMYLPLFQMGSQFG